MLVITPKSYDDKRACIWHLGISPQTHSKKPLDAIKNCGSKFRIVNINIWLYSTQSIVDALGQSSKAPYKNGRIPGFYTHRIGERRKKPRFKCKIQKD